MRRRSARAVARRLHALELATLRERVELQHAEIERLRERLNHAEAVAEEWSQDYLDLLIEQCADGKHAPALTRDGKLIKVSTEGSRCAG